MTIGSPILSPIRVALSSIRSTLLEHFKPELTKQKQKQKMIFSVPHLFSPSLILVPLHLRRPSSIKPKSITRHPVFHVRAPTVGIAGISQATTLSPLSLLFLLLQPFRLTMTGHSIFSARVPFVRIEWQQPRRHNRTTCTLSRLNRVEIDR